MDLPHSLTVGETLKTDGLIIASEEIIAFAGLWDPQPFHLSDEAGKETQFGGLFGSGLQSLCTLIKLGVESGFLARNSIAGLAIENLKFRNPLRPGMMVFGHFEVLEMRATSKSPNRSVARISARLISDAGIEVIVAELVNLYRSAVE
jgi:acyl dehydratase